MTDWPKRTHRRACIIAAYVRDGRRWVSAGDLVWNQHAGLVQAALDRMARRGHVVVRTDTPHPMYRFKPEIVARFGFVPTQGERDEPQR